MKESKPATNGKKAKAVPPPADEEPQNEPEEEKDEDDEDEEENEDAQALAIELDPEDENPVDEGLYKPGQPVGKIPDVSQAVQKAAKASTGGGETGVLYIGRVPHGFYEHEMKQYLSQFGPIRRLRLSRNKKTGASKHFAFIEFEEASTAEIVAKTMDNYLLFGHILKCRIVPKEQAHDDLFKGANKRFKKVPWNKIAGKQLEKPLSESVWEKKVTKEQSKRAKKAAQLKAMGYEFEAPAIKEIPAPAAKAIEDKETKAIEAPAEDETKEEAKEEAVEEKTVKSISAPKTKVTKAKAKKGGRKSKA